MHTHRESNTRERVGVARVLLFPRSRSHNFRGADQAGGFRETDRRKFLRWKVLGIIYVSTFLRRVCLVTKTTRTFANETGDSTDSRLAISFRMNKTIVKTKVEKKSRRIGLFAWFFAAFANERVSGDSGWWRLGEFSRVRNDVKRGGNQIYVIRTRANLFSSVDTGDN